MNWIWIGTTRMIISLGHCERPDSLFIMTFETFWSKSFLLKCLKLDKFCNNDINCCEFLYKTKSKSIRCRFGWETIRKHGSDCSLYFFFSLGWLELLLIETRNDWWRECDADATPHEGDIYQFIYSSGLFPQKFYLKWLSMTNAKKRVIFTKKYCKNLQ